MGIKTIVSGLIVGLSISSMTQAASVSLSPQVTSVNAGDNIAVDILIDFSDEPTLGGGIDVLYDASLVDYVSFSFNSSFESLIDPLMSCPSAGVCDPVSSVGLLENIAFGNFSGLGGSFNIGTLNFDALSAGSALFSTQANSSAGGPFVSANTWDVMPVTFNGASVTVSEVPLPAAGWFFLTGLTSLVISKRKK